MDLEAGFFDHLDLAEEYKLYRSFPVDDVERLERSVEQKYMFEDGLSLSKFLTTIIENAGAFSI